MTMNDYTKQIQNLGEALIHYDTCAHDARREVEAANRRVDAAPNRSRGVVTGTGVEGCRHRDR
jgi:hypothetical protein